MRNSLALLVLLLMAGCLSHKKTQQTTTVDPLASDRSVTLQFHPFWGGMVAGELERKGGKDLLTYTYIVHNVMRGDSTYSTVAPITKAQADSIFVQAEKAEWNSDIFFGTVTDPVGLNVYGQFKKGLQKQNATCQRLKNATELPAELLKLAKLMNDLAPEEFKLY